MAGGIACVVSHPLDTIRTQMAVSVGVQRSMGDVVRAVGLRGLYRGFGLSCFQEVVGNGERRVCLACAVCCYIALCCRSIDACREAGFLNHLVCVDKMSVQLLVSSWCQHSCWPQQALGARVLRAPVRVCHVYHQTVLPEEGVMWMRGAREGDAHHNLSHLGLI